MAQPTQNVPSEKQFAVTTPTVFPEGVFVVQPSKGGTKLTVLSGDEYSRTDFANLNDPEFTELLSSIEGIGVNEFFLLYEELKQIIPPGSLNIAFETTSTERTDNVFTDIEQAMVALRSQDFEIFNAIMDSVRDKVSALTTAISGAQPGTHAWLVQSSIPFITQLNTRFNDIFNYIVELLKQNADLREELTSLKQENEELKEQVKRLTDLILKLTAPESSGFQIVPDVFTTDTVGSLWGAGQSVTLVVCGSSMYEFSPGKDFTGGPVIAGAANPITPTTERPGLDFAWEQLSGTSKWIIYTSDKLAGKTAYITATSLNEPTKASSAPTEQIVFVFPGGASQPPGTSLLKSDLGTTIQLQIPIKGPNNEDTNIVKFAAQGNATRRLVTITGGTGPYTYRNNAGGGDTSGFYSVESFINEGGNVVKAVLFAKQNGDIASALTIRDAVGRTLDIRVVVTSIFVPAVTNIRNVQILSLDGNVANDIWVSTLGGSVEARIISEAFTSDINVYRQHPETHPVISAVGSTAGKLQGYIIERSSNFSFVGNIVTETILVDGFNVGWWDLKVTGGPDQQKFTDDLGVEHINAQQFSIQVSDNPTRI